MHFVGVDLAWGQNKPTGVAVLDGSGRLLHVGAALTDDEVLAAVRPWCEGEVVVGFDAPIVVVNATGNRPGEAALNRDFARFQAGAHPANLGKPEFRDTPRAARLAAALGLDLDPLGGASRRALEVYPHPATVSLFRLGRTLKYKNKPGRTVESLRAALLTLMGLVEGLEGSRPRRELHAGRSGWERLVAAAAAATRTSELRVVEDQVDAVVCAYVALWATRRPADTTVYGDPATGAIVVPTLPPGHEPAAGDGTDDGGTGGAADEEPARIAGAVEEYARRHPALVEAADRWVALVRSVLDEGGINYLSVTGRAKSVASFAGKAARRDARGLLYPEPLEDVTDQVGVRVVTYVLGDVAAVADLLADQVVVLDDRDLGRETASQGRFGYASRHLLVSLDPVRERHPGYEPLRRRVASVQIRTVLQHAWAEFEHDIRYKGSVPDEHGPEFDRRFTLAAGLLELADREFSAIRDRLRGTPDGVPEDDDDDPRIDARELAAFLAGQYPDAGWSRTDHYDWISGLLLELGVTSLRELSETLRGVDAVTLLARMDYRYPPGAVRRLDDALLARFGEQYVALPGNAHRDQALLTRLARLTAPDPEG